MTDVNVTQFNMNAVAALRSRIIEALNNTQKPGFPPNAGDIFDTVCGFYSEQVPIETDDEGKTSCLRVSPGVETPTMCLSSTQFKQICRLPVIDKNKRLWEPKNQVS